MAILNTHAVVKKFTQHGFTEEHAELIVDAINDQSDQLATKNDLAMLKTELKADILNLELKLESKIEHEISTLRGEIKDIKIDLLKWIIPLFLTILISNLGGLIALLK
ncbi:MAG: CCDC90 family protein [Rickettsia sp.]|nr:CCDC90 family protein [Rickettsia sp.]